MKKKKMLKKQRNKNRTLNVKEQPTVFKRKKAKTVLEVERC